MNSQKAKKIVILGSTGSIGTQTLNVIEKYLDKFQIVGLACVNNAKLIKQQGQRFNCENIFVASNGNFDKFFDECGNVDIVVSAISGFAGVEYSMKFLEKTKTMALANKETIVTFHRMFFEKASKMNVKIIPIDSENGTLYQLLNKYKNVNELIITASGGPFLKGVDKTKVKFTDAIKHPNWKMGEKVSIDSATMLNKGIELLEARRFFGMQNVSAIIQPQSIIHALLELNDNSIVGIFSKPDMSLHIAQAILDENEMDARVSEKLNLTHIKSLEFYNISQEQFPLFYLAKEIAEMHNSKSIAYNAADEACIDMFKNDKISLQKLEEMILYITKNAENKEIQNVIEMSEFHIHILNETKAMI